VSSGALLGVIFFGMGWLGLGGKVLAGRH